MSEEEMVELSSVIFAECPTCGASGPTAFGFITRTWDGETYGLACGHDHHMGGRAQEVGDERDDGCRTWMQTHSVPAAMVRPYEIRANDEGGEHDE